MINDQNFLQIQFGNKKKMEKRKSYLREGRRVFGSSEQKKFNKFQECRDIFCFAFLWEAFIAYVATNSEFYSAQPLSCEIPFLSRKIIKKLLALSPNPLTPSPPHTNSFLEVST